MSISCKICGTENPDGALFCMSCGKRLDGKKICPNCGKECADAAKFCPYCGTAFAAHAAPAKPVRTEEFVYDDEIPVRKTVPAEEYVYDGETAVRRTAPKRDVLKILGLCGGVLAMVSALFSLIFVFCIGLNASVNGSAESACTVYDYFSKQYEQISAALELYPKDSDPLALSYYLPAILCTVAASLGFVLVTLFSVLAAVKFAKELKDGEAHGYFKYAAAACMSFVAAACIFYAFASVGIGSVNVSGSASAQGDILFNEAIVAGIVLSVAFLILGAGLKVAARGRELFDLRTVLDCSLAVVGMGLAIAVFFLARMGQINAEELNTNANVRISLSISPIGLCSSIGLRYIADLNLSTPTSELSVAVCAAAAQVGVIVLLALKVCNAVKRLEGKKKGKGIVLSAILFGFSLLSLVMNVVFVPMYETYCYGETGSGLEYSYTLPIVIVILSALMLAESILSAVSSAKGPEPLGTEEPAE